MSIALSFLGVVQYSVRVFQSFRQKDFSDPAHPPPNLFSEQTKTCPLKITMIILKCIDNWIIKTLNHINYDYYFNKSKIEVFVFVNFTFFKWTGFWDRKFLLDRFLKPTHPPKSFRRKDWETRTENWTTPYFIISITLIYMDPDYNSPLIYWWGYCNLSILYPRLLMREGIIQLVDILDLRFHVEVLKPLFPFPGLCSGGPSHTIIGYLVYDNHCTCEKPFSSLVVMEVILMEDFLLFFLIWWKKILWINKLIERNLMDWGNCDGGKVDGGSN